jgi:hypothetical protein
VIHNLTGKAQDIQLPSSEQKYKAIVFTTSGKKGALNSTKVTVPAFGMVVLK